MESRVRARRLYTLHNSHAPTKSLAQILRKFLWKGPKGI